MATIRSDPEALVRGNFCRPNSLVLLSPEILTLDTKIRARGSHAFRNLPKLDFGPADPLSPETIPHKFYSKVYNKHNFNYLHTNRNLLANDHIF
jgi:hypothetical protein